MEIETNIQGKYRRRFNPQHVSLMLDNLVANSEKSNSTDIVFNMSIENERASIIVCDSGNGFNGIDVESIFEFGYSNTGGTGIGLFNVKTVISKMNGEIKAVENEPKGAKFIITLP